MEEVSKGDFAGRGRGRGGARLTSLDLICGENDCEEGSGFTKGAERERERDRSVAREGFDSAMIFLDESGFPMQRISMEIMDTARGV